MKYEQLSYTPVVIQVFLRNYLRFHSRAIQRMNEELIVLCADMSVALKSVRLTKRQRQALYYYVLGYTLEDIGLKMSISHPAVIGLVTRATEKISLFMEGELV